MSTQFNEEILQALHNIAAELKRLNQTLAASSSSAPAGRPPMGRPVGRPPASRPTGRPSTNRTSYSKEGGSSYSRSSDSKEGGFGKEGGASRFPKKPGSFGKGKPPVKKGDGYPKKAR